MSSNGPVSGAVVADGAMLARGVVLNAIAFVTSNLRGIFMFLVARLLGAAALGAFGLAWTATDLISKFTVCGLDTSAIAAVAASEADGDIEGTRRIKNAALLTSGGLSVVLAAAGFAILWPRSGPRAELYHATAIMLWALPGITLYRVSNALSRGMVAMHHDIYSRGLTESLVTTAAFLVAYGAGAREFAPEYGAIAGTLASGGVALWFAHRLLRHAPRGGASPPGRVAAMFRATASIGLYDLLNLAVMEIDVLILGLFVGRASGVDLQTLGIYAAGVQVAGGLRKVSQAFTPIFVPVISRRLAQDDTRGAEAAYAQIARWMLALLLPAVAALALSGGAILAIFGAGFRRGAPWMAIVGAACALNAFVGLGETILMVKRPALNLLNSSIAFAAAIGLNVLLIPRLGPLGAALAMLAPYTLQGVLRGVEISRVFDWRWPRRALVRPWIAAMLALPIPLAARLALGGAPLAQLACGILFLSMYFAVWRVMGLDEHDRAILNELTGRAAPLAVALEP